MSKLIVTIETITAGQRQRYSDSVYKFRVFCEYYWDSTTGPRLAKEYSLQDYEALDFLSANRSAPRWVAKENREWYQTYLNSVVEVEPGVWEIEIISPYLD